MTASTAEALVAHHGSVEGLVVRTRLLRVFDSGSRTLIGALVAPSGYGKTTLLRQWVSQEARPVAWLALRPEHGAAVRLLNAIHGRLAAIQHDADAEEPVVLVLDDAQRLP